MEESNEISPAIHQAIAIMETCFGGTEIKIVSNGMYRLLPDEFTSLGRMGVDITVKPAHVNIEPVKVFLGCESMAEEIAWTPYGQMIANEFVYDCLAVPMKKHLDENINKLKQTLKNNE